MPSERVFRTLDGVAGGEFVAHRVQILWVVPDQVVHHGRGKGGQFAFATFAGLVSQTGLALALPTVKPVINRDAANRKNTR